MTYFNTVDEILDFAIKGEETANAFYRRLADQAALPWMSDLFLDFAKEELGHKARLQAVKLGGRLKPAAEKVQDLKIAEYTADVDESSVTNFQDALVLAMKKEKKAFKLYTDLAEATDNADLRQTFLALAQEEAKHKLRIEIAYDEEVLKDN
ncbi:MAG: ferritin family protein [Thermodesulfobacteriota bacterium]